MQTEYEHIDKDGFRLRGTAMSRVDGFSDVVFGFALTLLVVSVEVPHTYDEFHAVLRGSFAFAICFLIFVTIWMAHFRFFRRYGLHDKTTLWINCALLFAMLIYVYPLKFLFNLATGHMEQRVFSNVYQQRELMIIYGLGFAAIYLCLAALYGNAWRQRVQLDLNPLEMVITMISFWNFFGNAMVGLICCLVARLLPPHLSGYAGYGFFLLLIWGRGQSLATRGRIRAARARTCTEDLHPSPHASE
jgi:uncharacterized membrane protein